MSAQDVVAVVIIFIVSSIIFIIILLSLFKKYFLREKTLKLNRSSVKRTRLQTYYGFQTIRLETFGFAL